jgi:hypothetical protein
LEKPGWIASFGGSGLRRGAAVLPHAVTLTAMSAS